PAPSDCALAPSDGPPVLSDGPPAHKPTGHAVSRAATGQKGQITRRQLESAGVGRRAIERRVRDGELHRVYRGVYVVGHQALAPLARESAAVLACGEGAVIRHSSGASLWGMAPPPSAGAETEVTVIGRKL